MAALSSLPQQRLRRQFQAFLKTPDLFAKQARPPYARLLTQQPTLLSPAILAHWETVLSPRLVLGKRVEYFMQYYLQTQEVVELYTHNLQIIRDQQTLGELDFLYYNKEEGQGYHLEQVYKFYIYWPEFKLSSIERWIGPNNKDTLVQKLSKLQQRQFPLLQHPATQTLLQQQGIPTAFLRSQLSFKAALFTPWGQAFPTDSLLNPTCWRGYWLKKTDFLRRNWQGAQFFIPEKQDWSTRPTSATPWQNKAAIVPLLEKWLDRQKAPLCWAKTSTGDFLSFFVLWW